MLRWRAGGRNGTDRIGRYIEVDIGLLIGFFLLRHLSETQMSPSGISEVKVIASFCCDDVTTACVHYGQKEASAS
jgi:hypothetical protein